MPFAAGCSGVQMTGWFKKETKSLADLKGLNMCIPGLAGRINAAQGVEVRQLPGGKIFPALGAASSTRPSSSAPSSTRGWACRTRPNTIRPAVGTSPAR